MSIVYVGNNTHTATVTMTGTLANLGAPTLLTAWLKAGFTPGSETKSVAVMMRGGSGLGNYMELNTYSGAAPSGPGELSFLASTDGGGTGVEDVGDRWLEEIVPMVPGTWYLAGIYMPANSAGSLTTRGWLGATAANSGAKNGDTDTTDWTRFTLGRDHVTNNPYTGRISNLAVWTPANLTAANNIMAGLIDGGNWRATEISGIASPIKYWPLLADANAGGGFTNNFTVSGPSFDGDEPEWGAFDSGSSGSSGGGSGSKLLLMTHHSC